PPHPPPSTLFPYTTLFRSYNQPTDTAAFEKYYAEKHVPLFASHAQEIGVTRVELVKFPATIDGQRPALYRMADIRFESRAALERSEEHTSELQSLAYLVCR